VSKSASGKNWVRLHLELFAGKRRVPQLHIMNMWLSQETCMHGVSLAM
jgi:hypothetical protein